jgi:hypothetical protein
MFLNIIGKYVVINTLRTTHTIFNNIYHLVMFSCKQSTLPSLGYFDFNISKWNGFTLCLKMEFNMFNPSYAWPINFFVTPISNNPLAIMYGAFKDECHFGCNGSLFYFLWTQIEIELKWKKKGWKYTWPQAQWQCNPTVTLQDLVSTSISCYYIKLVKFTSISKLLKFGRKKTRITIYQLCSTKVVNIKKDHIIMQGWTLYFHNFKLQPSLIYDEAYFWHNHETWKLFIALSHCFYS